LDTQIDRPHAVMPICGPELLKRNTRSEAKMLHKNWQECWTRNPIMRA